MSEFPQEKENPKKVQHPYRYSFIQMEKNHIGIRRESFANRLISYRKKYSLSQEKFAHLADFYARKYGTKVTVSDIKNYEYCDISPKIDKLYAISQVMGVDMDYFCGYGASNRKSRNPIIEARYRAKRNKRNNKKNNNGK